LAIQRYQIQLDIFADSRDVMLRNDVLDALHRRHAGDARQAWQTLGDEFPGDDSLAGLATLIDVHERDAAAPFTNHPALAAASCRLTDEVDPVARRVMGGAASAWLALCWRTVALQAAALAFRADVSDHHAAPLWLRRRLERSSAGC
jgi:hypothetical protein